MRRKKKLNPLAEGGRIQIILDPSMRKRVDAIVRKERLSLQTLGRYIFGEMVEFYEKNNSFWGDVNKYRRIPGRKRTIVEEIIRDMNENRNYEEM